MPRMDGDIDSRFGSFFLARCVRAHRYKIMLGILVTCIELDSGVVQFSLQRYMVGTLDIRYARIQNTECRTRDGHVEAVRNQGLGDCIVRSV